MIEWENPLRQQKSTGTVSYNVNMAAVFLTAIPPLVIYFVLGKVFVQGIAAGAIKGQEQTSMPQVSFEHIAKAFGSVTVLDGLNLTVDDGDFLVLLGPAGGGKTTLLNLLAGLLDVTFGRISIGDRDVTELDPKDLGLSMVFQSYALYPTKTVEGNLAVRPLRPQAEPCGS